MSHWELQRKQRKNLSTARSPLEVACGNNGFSCFLALCSKWWVWIAMMTWGPKRWGWCGQVSLPHMVHSFHSQNPKQGIHHGLSKSKVKKDRVATSQNKADLYGGDWWIGGKPEHQRWQDSSFWRSKTATKAARPSPPWRWGNVLKQSQENGHNNEIMRAQSAHGKSGFWAKLKPSFQWSKPL